MIAPKRIKHHVGCRIGQSGVADFARSSELRESLIDASPLREHLGLLIDGGISDLRLQVREGLLRGRPIAQAALRDRNASQPELRLRLGAQAVRVVSADFDAERNTARLLDLLKQVYPPYTPKVQRMLKWMTKLFT